jgi:radical SAM superfamily enzyme YgiQ (UPF0313 family)
MRTAQRITSEIKKNFDVPVVWGGIHPIIFPEECLLYADIVCLGEGEIPVWELAQNLSHGRQAAGIRSLWIKHDGIVEKNGLRPLIEDLDVLPFADFIEEGNKFLIDSGRVVEDPPIISVFTKNSYLIMSSRGCMFSCTYCCNSVIREKYKGSVPYLRRRSVDNVIGELKLAVENRPVRIIYFWDDIFAYDKSWIGEFCDKYSAKIGVPFFCYVHPQHTDRVILAKLVQAGLVCVSIGIQSGSTGIVRDIFGRSQDNRKILDFRRMVGEFRVPVRYDLITDNPYETRKDQDDTVELLLELGISRTMIYSLCYFPETPLTKKALDDGVISQRDLEQYSSKALNHFHMFLPLSRNKTHLFWNCVKAMAVNKFFSRSLVRMCKKSVYFENHPQLLFSLCRFYLGIFKPFLDNSEKRTRICVGMSDFLFARPKLIFSFFASENNGSRKTYCLKITNKLNKILRVQFICELSRIFLGNNDPLTQWSPLTVDLKAQCASSVYLDLKYPDLYASLDGVIHKCAIVKSMYFGLKGEGTFFLNVKCRVPGKILRRRFHHAGAVVCNL